jgi:tRNA threonylcarbamoyl adenosine modification protein YjeE
MIITNKKQMIKIATDLAQQASHNQIFALFGNLGMGKSFFASSFINALQQHKSTILSPTFSLLQTYQTSKGEIFHFDLYRLKHADELENIGFFQAINNNIMLIEWPQIALAFLPKNITTIIIDKPQNSSPQTRTIDIINPN